LRETYPRKSSSRYSVRVHSTPSELSRTSLVEKSHLCGWRMNGLDAEARLSAVNTMHAPFVDVFLGFPRPYAAASLVKVPPRRLVAGKDGGKTEGKKEARRISDTVHHFMHNNWSTAPTFLLWVKSYLWNSCRPRIEVCVRRFIIGLQTRVRMVVYIESQTITCSSPAEKLPRPRPQ
jgi:hypothetical protein